ncbi:MAG: hypothetical protein E7214_03725 [Clostridium sp.]|nr:hypothetical protein [Clostridium sp.]
MSSNSITKFQVSYGTSKQLLGGEPYLELDKWKMDLGKAIDIFMNKMRENGIVDYKASNIIIRCFKESLEVALLTDGDIQVKLNMMKVVYI